MRLFNKMKTTSNEFARVITWTPKWDTGAPMPQVFSNGQKIFLIYLVNVHNPNWGGPYVTMTDNTGEALYPLALVEFNGHTFRFGIANDEVYNGLSLWGKGLEFYAAHIIENSTWINELKNIHKVHRHYNEDGWKDKKHFALLFHDNIFEVIATSYKVETFNTTFGQLAI